MRLNLDRLEMLRRVGGKLIARCPACAEMGADRRGEHLFVDDDGRFGCVVNPGFEGRAHRQRIWELVGVPVDIAHTTFAPISENLPTTRGNPRLPLLRPLSVCEMAAIAGSRDWPSFSGLELLTRRGLLWHGMVWDNGCHRPAWIITDSSRRNAQARRLDGQPWVGIGEKKAKTLPGSDASWPIGAAAISKRPTVILCEGGPDFLAALLIAWWERAGASVEDIAPACVTGAGNSLNPQALPHFAGRRIRIPVHSDADHQGLKAGQRWADQLWRAGAVHVDGFSFAGLVRPDSQPIKDLADFATQLDVGFSPALLVTEDLAAGYIAP